MQYIDTIILAILQGLTEFLPISSSGHLVIGQRLLNINLPGNAFEVVLHLGTLMSVLTVFRGEIKAIIFNLSDSSNQYYIFALVSKLQYLGLLYNFFMVNTDGHNGHSTCM